MHPVYKNDKLGHIMAQNDEHGLEKHLAGGKNPWAPSKGPLRALSWQTGRPRAIWGQRYPCPALYVGDCRWWLAGQRPRRGRCPVEHRGTSAQLSSWGWNLSLRLRFEPWGWDLSLEAGYGLEAGIWAWRLGFEPGGWDLSLQAGIWASRLGFEPGDWDLSLPAEIWASGLEFVPHGWDLSLKAWIWALRLGF